MLKFTLAISTLQAQTTFSFLLKVLLFAIQLMVFNNKVALADFESRAEQAILTNSNGSVIFFQKNEHQPFSPASLSKLMTLIVIFDEMKAGRLKGNDKIKISVNAWRNGGAPSGATAMFAPVNSLITVGQAIRAITIQSANDAAIAIAEHIAGSEAKFAELLQIKAKEIGLKNSVFKNATGLSHQGHQTTVFDLATTSQYMINNYPELYKIFSEPAFRYRRYNFLNRNPLLRSELGVDGLKTGFSKQSKYNYAVSARRQTRRLIAVISGLETKKASVAEARRLLNYGFSEFKPKELFDERQFKTEARVWGGQQKSIRLENLEPIRIFLNIDSRLAELEAEVYYSGPLKAPIKKGQKVAKLQIKTPQTVQEFPLYASENIKPSGFIKRGWDSLFYMLFGWAL